MHTALFVKNLVLKVDFHNLCNHFEKKFHHFHLDQQHLATTFFWTMPAYQLSLFHLFQKTMI